MATVIQGYIEGIKKGILFLAQNEDTKSVVKELIETNPCIDSIEGFTALIDLYGQIVEQNGKALEDMALTVLSVR